jgi:GNAT superfamily N-acetyltransferase
VIRELKPSEFDSMKDLLKEGFGFSQFMGSLDCDKCISSWRIFVTSGVGVVIGLVEDGKINGALAGYTFNDLNSNDKIAVESHFYIKQNHRGKGLALLSAFQNWAKQHGAKLVRVTRLLDQPEKLNKVYRRLGYDPIQITYQKEL